MTARRKLVIPRDRWARGGGGGSRLLQRDGQKCCIGHYLSACGVPDLDLFEMSTPEELVVARILALSTEASWLLGHNSRFMRRDSDDALSLIRANDDPAVGADERELRVREIFAVHDVDVTFVDSLSEAP